MKKSEKVKTFAECLAADLSWCLSANFEKDCKLREDYLYRSSVLDDFAKLQINSDDEDSMTLDVFQDTPISQQEQGYDEKD
jgi:hypothetical protein